MATTKKLAVASPYYGNTAHNTYATQDTNHLFVGKYKTTTYRSRLTVPALSGIAEIGTDRIRITSIKLYVRPNDGSSTAVKFGCSASSAWGAALDASAARTLSVSDGYQEIDLSSFASAVQNYSSKWYLHMLANASSPSTYIRIDSTGKAKKPYLTITWEKVAATISGNQDSAILGSTTVTFAITPEVDNETHDLTYAIGESEGTIASGAGNSISWTPPVALASEIPDDDSGIAEIRMTAYDSSGRVQRTETYYQTVTVPESIMPSITDAGIALVNGLSGYPLAGRSEFSIAPVIDMTGAYSASIRELTASVTGITEIRWTALNETDPGVFTAPTAKTGVLPEGAVSVTITVTDSRGRTATSTASYNVLPYSPPEIALFSVERYEPVYDENEAVSGYVVSDVGDRIWVNLSIRKASVKPGTTELNTVSWIIEGESASGSTTTKSGTATALTQNRTTLNFTVPEDESWTFAITVTDAAGGTAKQYSAVAPGHAAFSISPDKWGAAVGMIANGTKARPLFEVSDKYESRLYGGVWGADCRMDRAEKTGAIGFDETVFEQHDAERPPVISRVGPIVFMDGALQSKSDIAAGSKMDVATLPEWARPNQVVSVLQQGKNFMTYWIVVYPDGRLEFSRYRSGAASAAVPKGGQLSMTACWLAADAFQ